MKHHILFIDTSKGSDDFALFKKKLSEFVSDLKKTNPTDLLTLVTLGPKYCIQTMNQSLNDFDCSSILKLEQHCNLCLFDILAPAMKKVISFHNISELKTNEINALIFVRGTLEESVIVTEETLLLQFMYAFQKKWKIFFMSESNELSLLFKKLSCTESFVYKIEENCLNAFFSDLKTLL